MSRRRQFRYDREETPYRRAFNRKFRRQCRAAAHRGDEALPRWRGTQGWLTW